MNFFIKHNFNKLLNNNEFSTIINLSEKYNIYNKVDTKHKKFFMKTTPDFDFKTLLPFAGNVLIVVDNIPKGNELKQYINVNEKIYCLGQNKVITTDKINTRLQYNIDNLYFDNEKDIDFIKGIDNELANYFDLLNDGSFYNEIDFQARYSIIGKLITLHLFVKDKIFEVLNFDKLKFNKISEKLDFGSTLYPTKEVVQKHIDNFNKMEKDFKYSDEDYQFLNEYVDNINQDNCTFLLKVDNTAPHWIDTDEYLSFLLNNDYPDSEYTFETIEDDDNVYVVVQIDKDTYKPVINKILNINIK